MKNLARALLIALLIISLPTPLAFATAKPKINSYPSVIDADSILISGTTEANASIQIVGGAYEMAPIKADSKGKFQITLALAQEKTNTFQFTATGKDGRQSDAVTIKITESSEEAQKKEEETGKDLTAPEKPEIDEPESPIDAKTVTLTGTAEPKATIVVSGDDSVTAKITAAGEFEVEVFLKQNKLNTFEIRARDSAGNISGMVKVEIEEKTASNPNNDEKKDADDKDNETDNTNDDDANNDIVEPAPVTETSFPDTKDHWAEEYILKLRGQGAISGYENGNFGPNDFITRAALTKIALLTFEYDIPQRVEDTGFKDVAKSAWFATFVQEAKKQNIVQGFDDDTFRPDEPITRAAALKILLAASGIELKNIDTSKNFPDVKPDDWFAIYTAFAKERGIISGYAGDNTFRPGAFITRAEVCKIAIKIQEVKAEILATPTI